MDEIKINLSFSSEHFIGKADAFRISDNHEAEIELLKNKFNPLNPTKEYQFFNLPETTSVAEEVIEYCEWVGEKFDTLVVFGIGGSSITGKSINFALNNPLNNTKSYLKKRGKKIFFIDSVDPVTLQNLFEILEIEKTLFNFISKSGTTIETVAQFLTFKNFLNQTLKAAKIPEHIVVTTAFDNNPLMKIAVKERIKLFEIPQHIIGRFSALTPAGLLPAAFMGIDILKILSGASEVKKSCNTYDPKTNPALLLALLNSHFYRKGKKNHVIMPYSDALQYISLWFKQLISESISNCNNVCYDLPTPLISFGVTDQHSQIQTYVEGPSDKLITFLTVKNFPKTLTIPEIYIENHKFSFLRNQNFQSLIDSEKKAFEFMLSKKQKPSYTLEIEEISEITIGKLIFLFELQTVYSALLLNTNPFLQPVVEDGKNFTRVILNSDEFDSNISEITTFYKKQEESTSCIFSW